MIADLLEYYYEVYEPRANYEIVRSIVVDGHESAWCAYSGELIGGEDGERFSTHVWVCECDFTEGVGWYVEDGRRFTKDGPRHCLPRKAALRLVQLELHEEYMGRFGKGEFGTSTYELRAHLGEIVADLAGRVEAGECIGEDGTGAAFWGGWFYLGTLAAITDSFVGHLWDPVAKLVEQGKVGLGGAVITPYRAPPEVPVWEEYLRIERDGYVGVASLPGFREMSKAWKLEVFDENGEPAYQLIPGLALDHDPVFGPDVDDVAAAKGRLDELIDACLERAGGLVGAKAQRDELVAEALRRETRSSLVRAKDLFGLTNSEVADLFGVDRQVVDQWGECGEISDNVREKLASLLLVGDLLSRRLAPGRLPIVARRRADAYGGITMLDMVATGRGTELCELTEPVFDWAGTS